MAAVWLLPPLMSGAGSRHVVLLRHIPYLGMSSCNSKLLVTVSYFYPSFESHEEMSSLLNSCWPPLGAVCIEGLIPSLQAHHFDGFFILPSTEVSVTAKLYRSSFRSLLNSRYVHSIASQLRLTAYVQGFHLSFSLVSFLALPFVSAPY